MAGEHPVPRRRRCVPGTLRVVRKDLRELVLASRHELLAPPQHPCVRLRPASLRDARVRDVAGQDVVEDELTLAGDDGPVPLPQQSFLDQGWERRCVRVRFEAFDRSLPEDATDDGRRLQHALLLGRQKVETRGDDALDRVGERGGERPGQCPSISAAHQGAGLDDHAKKLLRVERVPLRSFHDGSDRLRWRRQAGEEVPEQIPSLRRRQRGERDRGGGTEASAPPGPRLHELGPGHAEEQDGPGDPRRQILDQAEQARVGPVEVLQDRDHGSGCDRFEEGSPRPGDELLGRAPLRPRERVGRDGNADR